MIIMPFLSRVRSAWATWARPAWAFLSRVRPAWGAVWPCCLLLAFAALAVIRLLPGGYARAVLAAPVMLLVPGAVTLGGLRGDRRHPKGPVFACCAALLSVFWAIFASLALYVLRVRITPGSTYCSLLVITAISAAIAQIRLLLSSPARDRRPVHAFVLAAVKARQGSCASTATARRGAWAWPAFAVVTGITLLTGATFAQARLPHPAPTGYTWLAWTGPRTDGVSVVSRQGIRLPFEIVHHESGTGTFRLQAEWLTTPAQPLTKPATLRIGADRTYSAALSVPPLRNGCTYRIVITLTAVGHIDRVTGHPQTWSINADLHGHGRSANGCPG